MLQPSNARGLVVPRLTGIPRRQGVVLGRELRAQLALAMLDAGVADPALWRGRGTPEAFIQRALQSWVEHHGGDETDDHFGLSARVATSLCDWFQSGDDETEAVFLLFTPVSYGFKALGDLYAWLERTHPRLPATVRSALLTLNKVAWVYDHHDALEHVEMMLDGMDERDIEEYYGDRFEKIDVPKSLGRKALSAATVARLRSGWSWEIQRVVSAALALQAAGARITRPGRVHELPHDYLAQYDFEQSPPALLIALQEHDGVQAAFDDFLGYYGQSGCPAEPSCVWVLAMPGERPTVARVRRAFDGLARAVELFAAAGRLFEAIPGKSRLKIGSLAQVIGDAEGCGPIETPTRVRTRVEVAA